MEDIVLSTVYSNCVVRTHGPERWNKVREERAPEADETRVEDPGGGQEGLGTLRARIPMCLSCLDLL